MPLRSTLSRNDVQYHKEEAQEEFPTLGPDEALTAYAELHHTENLFFHGKDGNRCVWREDLRYSANLFFGTKEISCGRNIYYFRWPNTKKLAGIDRPKNPELLKIVAHPSESGWNLPQSHKRYFLKFPPDLKHNPQLHPRPEPDEELRPSTNTSNLKKRCKFPDYHAMQEHWDLATYTSVISCPFMSWTEMQDAEGSYTKLRHIYRKPIDATLLRINKFFNRVGRSMLYGDNVLSFEMTQKDWKRNPAYCRTIGTRHFIHNPNPQKPSLAAATLGGLNTADIDAIRQGGSVYTLPGWLYHDRFLRCLHTIGPKNAAVIRTLKFRGIVKLHTCNGYEGHGYCNDDLVYSLKFYVPFIKELCTGLEALIIEYSNDDHSVQFRTSSEPTTTEESLRPFLEHEIMQIQSLRVLQVTERNMYDTVTPDFAKPTIARVTDRAKARTDAATKWDVYFLKLKTERGQKAKLNIANHGESDMKLSCGFCGEEHVSVECWNLCNYCGEFGHFRKGCLRAEEY
ncbi:hypothetical protein DL98DRAFT_621636 [Cadophora sp. DSE1049]|nr:hypothetical protein DL98DRAFT_621636 [Cadophora sp. DSE1049]